MVSKCNNQTPHFSLDLIITSIMQSADTGRERTSMSGSLRENQRMSMRDLEVLSSIDPITTTSTGDSERQKERERQRQWLRARGSQAWEPTSECVRGGTL